MSTTVPKKGRRIAAPPTRRKRADVETEAQEVSTRVKERLGESSKEEQEAEQTKLAREATPADEELAELLTTLKAIQDARRKDPELERRYEGLRATVTSLLKRPRVFLYGGFTTMAFVKTPTPLKVDVEELIAMELEGGLPYDVLEEVAPRKVDLSAFRKAVGAGRITAPQLLRCSELVTGTSYVHFAPIEENSDEQQ